MMELNNVVTLLPLHFILLSSLQSLQLSSVVLTCYRLGWSPIAEGFFESTITTPSIYESKGGDDFSGLHHRLMMCGQDLDAHHNIEIDFKDVNMKDPFRGFGLCDTFEGVIVGLSQTSKVLDGFLKDMNSFNRGHSKMIGMTYKILYCCF